MIEILIQFSPIFIPILVLLVILIVKDRKASAVIAELEAGGTRRDAALAALPEKPLAEKIRESSIHTKRVRTIKTTPVGTDLETCGNAAEPFSNSRVSRLN